MSKLDELLYESLAPSHEPSDSMNRRIMDRRKEMKQVVKMKKRIATAAAFGCVLLAGGTSVYAVSHYLRPSEIASAVSDGNVLARAFESKGSININETQKAGEYLVTLLGMTSGKDLALCVSENEVADMHDDRSYVTLAISRADGEPMKDENKTLSPLVAGIDWKDVTIADMDATLHWFSKDGVVYELLECDNLEIFASRGVQLGVVDQFGDEAAAYEMDEETGKYEKTKGYEGTNALFSLPIDQGKGDEAAVAAYLEKAKDERNQADENSDAEADPVLSTEVADFEQKISKMSADEAGQYIRKHCVRTNIITLPYDKNGDFRWGEEYDDSETTWMLGGSSGIINLSGYKPGVPTFSHMDSDGTKEGTSFTVITVGDDGKATMEVYSLQ